MPDKSNSSWAALTHGPLQGIDDAEGDHIPSRIPPVIDAHVHVFPDPLFHAVWEWFDTYGWPIRYQMSAHDLVAFLHDRGVHHVVALQYAHRPGIADSLNGFMADLCERHPWVTGMATVYPGEPDAVSILERGFSLGLSGVKLHAHVQCFELDSPGMHDVYALCTDRNKPLIMHAGREPKSPAYPCDPYEICRIDLVEQVLDRYPDLRLCVPHMGADEFDAYAKLVRERENLWLDTTMTLADYLPSIGMPVLPSWRLDRVMFGTDFPNIPYAWDREIRHLLGEDLRADQLEAVLGGNAAEFYGINL